MDTPEKPRDEIRSDFVFRLRKVPVPGDLRPVWRVVVLLLMLYRSGRNSSMSLKKCLLLNWGVRSSHARATLRRMLDGERRLDDIPVRFDLSLNRAIAYASAEGLVHVGSNTTGSVISLTATGEKMAKDIYEDKGSMISEIQFFDYLRGKLPEKKVKELLTWEASA